MKSVILSLFRVSVLPIVKRHGNTFQQLQDIILLYVTERLDEMNVINSNIFALSL